MNVWVLLAATLPGVLISYAIFRADRYEREPLWLLLLCFAGGGLMTLPVVRAEIWALRQLGYPPASLLDAAILSFGVLAPLEELSKWLLLALVAFPSRAFNEPMDGIVYAVLIAMGFASVENIAYADRFGWPILLTRTLTAVPAHLAFAIVQGYYAGKAQAQPGRQRHWLFLGLLLAALVHGLYDLLVIQGWSQWLVFLGVAALYPYLYFLSGLVRQHQEQSPFR
ncbi:MAG: PrsW family glutamic-type intramembrane protease [Saprospiraceae bacterium]|nr:PrsW family glutamic-type intramembrane protease [Saprospiraceae bacterium]MDW8229713.1 PrsW family glutamic-type intramembrane protease [Saprospiraceae bacterium]